MSSKRPVAATTSTLGATLHFLKSKDFLCQEDWTKLWGLIDTHIIANHGKQNLKTVPPLITVPLAWSDKHIAKCKEKKLTIHVGLFHAHSL